MAIHTIEIPKGKGTIKSFILAADWHGFYLNPHCYRLLKILAKEYGIKDLVIMGDFLDLEFLFLKSPLYRKWIKRGDGMDEFFVPMMEREAEWGNNTLDEVARFFNRIWFLMGNHEYRTEIFKETCQVQYTHNFDIPNKLHLQKRGVVPIPYNDWLDIGNMSLVHGIYHGASALKRHHEASKSRNVIFGHLHYESLLSFITRGSTTIARSMPAMCNLNPEYLKNRPNNWTNGLSILHVRNDGDFNYFPFTIWNGETILPNGKKIKLG